MKIPEGMTQQEVLGLINKIATRLAPKFVFGYHTFEDIKQQAFIEACKGLEKYDGKRPLENFLWVHIKNRLCNYKRDHFERIDKICLRCPLKAYDKSLPSECKLHEDKLNCDLYRAWLSRNEPKKNLVNCLDIDNIDDACESKMRVSVDMDGGIEHKRVIDLIDEKLPMHLRQSYLKLKAGQKVSRRDREEIKAVVASVMEL